MNFASKSLVLFLLISTNLSFADQTEANASTEKNTDEETIQLIQDKKMTAADMAKVVAKRIWLYPILILYVLRQQSDSDVKKLSETIGIDLTYVKNIIGSPGERAFLATIDATSDIKAQLDNIDKHNKEYPDKFCLTSTTNKGRESSKLFKNLCIGLDDNKLVLFGLGTYICKHVTKDITDLYNFIFNCTSKKCCSEKS